MRQPHAKNMKSILITPRGLIKSKNHLLRINRKTIAFFILHSRTRAHHRASHCIANANEEHRKNSITMQVHRMSYFRREIFYARSSIIAKDIGHHKNSDAVAQRAVTSSPLNMRICFDNHKNHVLE